MRGPAYSSHLAPVVGTDSPTLVVPLGHLAALLAEQGFSEKAIEYFERGLRIAEISGALNDPGTVDHMEVFQKLLLGLGREAEAEQVSQRAASGGPSPP